ncbi:hypothetical protein SynMITS9220_00870 [Synechococcus sp. MIT S9220]|nr:hypothetical protein SynMITS9220_00870 [Synechococcus sp. MIT S9220]
MRLVSIELWPSKDHASVQLDARELQWCAQLLFSLGNKRTR